MYGLPLLCRRDRDRDRMVVGFTTTYAISTYHHERCELESHSGDTTLCEIKNLNVNNKTYLYKFLKQNENEMEYYLSHPDRNVRPILTKFRLSEHKHSIEIDRNLKIPRDERLCAICKVLEDEFHFFFECKRNTNNRNILYQYFQNIYSNFLELNHEEKLTIVLNPSTPEQIRAVTSFIRTERGRLVTVIIAVHIIVFFLCSHVCFICLVFTCILCKL